MVRTRFRHGRSGRRGCSEFPQAADVLESRVLLSGIAFEDVTAAAGIIANRGFGFSTAWVDVNTDGLADLWIGRHGLSAGSNLGELRPNPILYVNQGNGTFVDYYTSVFPDLAERDNHGSAWADIDNDGDPDFLQTVGGQVGLAENSDVATNRLYLNHGGVFVDATRTAGLGMPIARGREAEWLDADRDGFLDAFLANAIRFDGLSPSRLLLQTGGGWDGARPALSYAENGFASAQFQDVNADGIPDLVCLTEQNTLEIALGSASADQPFADGGALLAGISFVGTMRDFAFGDFNGDLFTDLVVVTHGSGDLLLLFDPASGVFVDSSATAGMQMTYGTQVVAADLDNDGDLDVYVGCESTTTDLPDVIYENRGDGTFSVRSGNLHRGDSQLDYGVGRKTIASDFDNDGFIDLFQNGTGLAATPNQLLRNSGNTNHWLGLELSGVRSNRDGIGARVEITAGGVSQVRFQSSGKHQFAQNDPRLHFGLGDHTLIESLIVYWPSGEVTTLSNVPVDQILTISESVADLPSLARPILVESGAADLHDYLTAGAAQQYFRFIVSAEATLHLELTGIGVTVAVLDSTGSVVLASGQTADGHVSIKEALPQGLYLLRVSLQDGAEPVSFRLSPRLIPGIDLWGPVVEDITLDDSLRADEYAIVAVVSDAIHGGSALAAAEFFVDTAGAPGTGLAMAAVDGNWGVMGELVRGFIPAVLWDGLLPGAHTVFVRAQDAEGNWGELAMLSIEKQISASPSLDLMTDRMSLTYGVPAEVVFPDIDLSDSDSPSSAGAAVTLLLDQAITGYAWGFVFDERLTKDRWTTIWFDGIPVAVQYYTSKALRIRFNENATPATMREVLKRLKIQKLGELSPSPKPSQKTLRVIVSDNSGGRVGATMVVNVGVPEIRLDRKKLTYVENASPQRIAPSAGISESDPSGYIGGSFIVSFASGTAYRSGSAPQDRLGIENTGSASGEIGLAGEIVTYEGVPIGVVTGGTSGIPLKVMFNENVTQDAVIQLVRSVTFETLSENPSTRIRNLSFVLQHANGTTDAPAYTTVTVEAVNDPPVITIGSSQQRYVENAPPVVLASGALVTDVDSANFTGGSLTASLASGGHISDLLAIQHQGTGAGQIGIDGINVTYGGVFIGTFSGGTNLTPLQIMLTGTASITSARQLLRSVSFQTPGDNPRAGSRKVSFVLNDGDGGTSAAAFKSVKVEPVNDAPVVSMGSSQQRYIRNAVPVLFATDAVVMDVDSPNFAGGSLMVSLISGGDANDQLAIQNQGTKAGQIGINGTDVMYGGVLIGSFTGGTQLTPLLIMLTANANAEGVRQLIGNVTFQTSGDMAPTGIRMVSFVLDDGDGEMSVPAFREVQVELPGGASAISGAAASTASRTSRAVTTDGPRAMSAPVTPSSRIADLLFVDPDKDRIGLFGAL